ncbi:uncharacterized protein [Physcomitrium patens]|nr:uncharacterized protein LOC112294164 isoform X4 [Physcomitrium patens]|eukprot:XP_024400144.1 uncharacterized protein LOC112294164 isoform X4 [Physcomitrella patens]
MHSIGLAVERTEARRKSEAKQKCRGGTSRTGCSFSDLTNQKSTSEEPANQLLCDKENDGNRKILLFITVEIEDGSCKHIQMKEGDSAEGVATQFCNVHSLPRDCVAPLTEHILNNIIDISKKDENILFCSEEERHAYEARLNHADKEDYFENRDSSFEKNAAGESERQYHYSSSATPFAESQNINRPCRRVPVLPPRTVRKKRNNFAEQQRQCAILSRSHKFVRPERDKKRRKRRLSDTEMAACLRLHSDSFTRKERHLDMCRQHVKLFAENVNSSKVKSPKKSWKTYRRRSEIASRYENYGELLYTEGMFMKEKYMKEIERKKRQERIREMISCSGKPHISERAKNLQRDGNIWDKLAAEKFDHEQLRFEVMEAKMAECTFMPHINHHQQALEQTDESVSRFDQLFFDFESRRQRQNQYSDWYPEGLTFQPVINRRSNDADDKSRPIVFDRLSQIPKEMLYKKASKKDVGNCSVLVDKSTGRKLFTPMTGREPHTDRNPMHLPVGVLLYEMQATQAGKKEALLKEEEKLAREKAKCNFVNPKSYKYLARLKQRAFKKIFNTLDADNDGYLQLSKVDAKTVSWSAAEDIETLIKMGKGNELLSYDSFVALMQEVEEKNHPGFTVRGNLRHIPHADRSNLNLQHKVDGVSSDLAARRRKYSDQWYKFVLQDVQKRKQKVEDMRKERQRIEMKECTFVPEFSRSSSRNRGQPKLESIPQPARVADPPVILEKMTVEIHGFVSQGD